MYITVDITANYPKKEMILQDFMDVEYIPLETTDEFICINITIRHNGYFPKIKNIHRLIYKKITNGKWCG